MPPAYAELHVTSNFSFLEGASHPEELMVSAAALGLEAIAITDRNSLAGVVRAHVAAEKAGIRLIVGARLDFQVDESDETFSLLALPTDRAAYGRLSRLITLGRRRAPKGECRLGLADLAEHEEGQILLALPPDHPDDAFAARLAALARRRPGDCFLAAAHRHRGDDAARLVALEALARRAGAPLVACNDVHYHVAERRPLQDVVSAIRHRTTVAEAGLRLAANAERHLKPPDEMARLFAAHPQAIHRTVEIAARCRFRLDELHYEYPAEPVPAGETAQGALERLTWEGARERYGADVPARVAAMLEHELELIGELDYAPYFLTVHDLVRFARARGILCQGRGSAANSAVCYCLAITAVDPSRLDLLFERFISAERNEPPDIDVDFAHERREEVIQYVYRKYGRDRAGLAATVISYRGRSAIREVGKAMGLSEDVVDALARNLWGRGVEDVEEDRVRELGLDPREPTLAMTLRLAASLIGFPRHLSQHVGGFVITRGPLSEVVPVENAAMEDRTVIEWDKNDLAALGMLKIDLLGLGMLTCIDKGLALLARHHGLDLDLAAIPAEDPAVYDMLCRADSIGVFQVESRAQMSMLPRLKPRSFYDLVIEVAIVRPGPIQGNMVHPYLRRRSGEEPVAYPSPALEEVLGKTLGVPLFQEQAMRIAVVAAGFTPGEADALRRAMAAWRR
ncbi:MAG: error-prone DNA polymerase, partial [Alphaproteobacteria bacterium]